MFVFPWTNLHELNLDWILSKVKTLWEQAEENNEKADYAVETADEAKTIAEQAAEAQIGDGAVTTAKLADDAVTAAKLANNSVYSSNIVDGEVNTDDIAEGAITTSRILDGAVTQAKIFDGAVTSSKIGNNAITNAKILDGAINTPKLSQELQDRGNFLHAELSNVTIPESTDYNVVSLTLPTGKWFVVCSIEQRYSGNIIVNCYPVGCDNRITGKSEGSSGVSAFGFGYVNITGTSGVVYAQSYAYDSAHREVNGRIFAFKLK